jgi:hypothetical protein
MASSSNPNATIKNLQRISHPSLVEATSPPLSVCGFAVEAHATTTVFAFVLNRATPVRVMMSSIFVAIFAAKTHVVENLCASDSHQK